MTYFGGILDKKIKNMFLVLVLVYNFCSPNLFLIIICINNLILLFNEENNPILKK